MYLVNINQKINQSIRSKVLYTCMKDGIWVFSEIKFSIQTLFQKVVTIFGIWNMKYMVHPFDTGNKVYIHVRLLK